jgi:hypothetical protein
MLSKINSDTLYDNLTEDKKYGPFMQNSGISHRAGNVINSLPEFVGE